MGRIILSLLFILFTATAFCQGNIVGKVYSIADSTPVAGISISINNKFVARSDSNGIFPLGTNKKKITLSTEFGYPTTFNVNDIADTIKIFVYAPINSQLAQYDILHGRIQFYCGGGIAPMAISPADKSFEKTYNVNYHLFDCMIPERSRLISYNQIIAIYLDKKFGTGWREQVRPDIWGVTREIKWQE